MEVASKDLNEPMAAEDSEKPPAEDRDSEFGMSNVKLLNGFLKDQSFSSFAN